MKIPILVSLIVVLGFCPASIAESDCGITLHIHRATSAAAQSGTWKRENPQSKCFARCGHIQGIRGHWKPARTFVCRLRRARNGVEPVFPAKDDGISYEQARVRFRAGEIRVLDSSGNVKRSIAFDESNQGL